MVRLSKRAVKRDAADGGIAVMCSWNLSALALEVTAETTPLATALRDFLAASSSSIAAGLTEDPAPAVTEPIKLPEGVSREQASRRLDEMGAIVQAALEARSKEGARAYLKQLFGREVEDILTRERRLLQSGLKGGSVTALGSALGVVPKPTRSGGA